MQLRKLSNKHRCVVLLAGLIIASPAKAQSVEFDGNLKYQLVNTAYPAGSLIRDLTDKNVADHAATARFNIAYKSSDWAATVSYQAIGLAGQ